MLHLLKIWTRWHNFRTSLVIVLLNVLLACKHMQNIFTIWMYFFFPMQDLTEFASFERKLLLLRIACLMLLLWIASKLFIFSSQWHYTKKRTCGMTWDIFFFVTSSLKFMLNGQFELRWSQSLIKLISFFIPPSSVQPEDLKRESFLLQRTRTSSSW